MAKFYLKAQCGHTVAVYAQEKPAYRILKCEVCEELDEIATPKPVALRRLELKELEPKG